VHPKKLGACPQPSNFALLNLLSGTCPDQCVYDSECGGGMKCCLSDCGLKCIVPDEETVYAVPPPISDYVGSSSNRAFNSAPENDLGPSIVLFLSQ